jgi:hypothetical protein
MRYDNENHFSSYLVLQNLGKSRKWFLRGIRITHEQGLNLNLDVAPYPMSIQDWACLYFTALISVRTYNRYFENQRR